MVPRSQVTIAMSSVSEGTPQSCNDGNHDTFCATKWYGDDSSMSLTASYPCPSGRTSLSKVFVVNRRNRWRNHLMDHQLLFLDSSGKQDMQPIRFNAELSTYTLVPQQLSGKC